MCPSSSVRRASLEFHSAAGIRYRALYLGRWQLQSSLQNHRLPLLWGLNRSSNFKLFNLIITTLISLSFNQTLLSSILLRFQLWLVWYWLRRGQSPFSEVWMESGICDYGSDLSLVSTSILLDSAHYCRRRCRLGWCQTSLPLPWLLKFYA